MSNHGWGNNPEPGDNKGEKRPDNNKPGNNQGPPDLEEVWRDVTQRIKGMLGGKQRPPGNSGGGFGGGNRPNLNARQFGGGAIIIIGLIVIVWLASGFYSVQEGARGVVLRFGKYADTTSAGLRWHLPYPIETVEIVNVSAVQTLEIGYRGNENNRIPKESLMLTDDENILNVMFAVQYQLNDPEQWLFSNRSQEETVTQVAEASIRAVVGSHSMDFVLNTGRAEIAQKTQALMQELLEKYKIGVTVRNVSIQSTQPPDQVKAAFDDATNAGQDRQRVINEGQAYANRVIPLAKGTASRLAEEAEGYKQSMIATAEGDASRFKQILTEYSKAPDVTRSRMYLDTMQQVYSNTSKIMIDAKGQGNLLYLPLDKLMAATGAAASADAARQGDTTPQVTPPTVDTKPAADGSISGLPPDRRRDGLRSRERGER